MKTKTRFSLTLLSLLPAATLAAPGNLGVGVEGTTTSPAPAIRVYLTDVLALNFNVPYLRMDHQDDSHDFWGMEIGAAILPMQRSLGPVRHGPRLGASLSNSYYNYESGPSDQSFALGLNAGWDLEYFVAAVPGLSLGGNVGVRYGYNWRELPGAPDRYGHEIGGMANSFNLRYYF
jgi:hypothetical protein